MGIGIHHAPGEGSYKKYKNGCRCDECQHESLFAFLQTMRGVRMVRCGKCARHFPQTPGGLGIVKHDCPGKPIPSVGGRDVWL